MEEEYNETEEELKKSKIRSVTGTMTAICTQEKSPATAQTTTKQSE